ncbi:MAG: SoxR reducing system RseC family protein [Actinobacteria bacterium]|nr:SoxR reducing system RseC family protein [Actinomycetota bacterium]
MECRAVVMEVKGGRAKVRVARVNCAECGGCGLLARDREQVMEFSATARLGVEEGDEVILEVPSGHLLLSYLVVFGLPLVGMAAAYLSVMALAVLAGFGGAGPAVMAAVAAGGVSLWLGVRLAERRGLSPTIIRVLGKASDGCGSRFEGGEHGGEVL